MMQKETASTTQANFAFVTLVAGFFFVAPVCFDPAFRAHSTHSASPLRVDQVVVIHSKLGKLWRGLVLVDILLASIKISLQALS